MYEIYIRQDGTFSCVGRLQDGTEYWDEKSLSAAIISVKKFARAMNGVKIKRSDITIYEQKMVQRWVVREP